MREKLFIAASASVVVALVLAVAAPGCGGDDAGANGASCGGPTAEERAQNQAVFDALYPTCVGCHLSGARGYFASIEAFESLLAYNTKDVVPGKPEESELIRLITGKGTRAF